MGRLYIAYGSNLNKAQMASRCPGAKPIGTSTIEGYGLLFKGSRTGAYLTIERRDGRKVPVAVWEITAEDEKSLDRYEGYPTFYRKQGFTLKVKTEGGEKELDCFAYVMDEGRKRAMPSDYYVMVCLKGYGDFGFDEGPLAEAYHESKEERRRSLYRDLKPWRPK